MPNVLVTGLFIVYLLTYLKFFFSLNIYIDLKYFLFRTYILYICDSDLLLGYERIDVRNVVHTKGNIGEVSVEIKDS